MRVRITAAVSFCLAGILVSAALAAEKLPSGTFLQDPTSVGRWSIRRVTSDGAGRKVLSCQATWTREGDLYVYASLDVAKKTFTLGVPAIRPPRGKPATLRLWFDDDKAGAMEAPVTFISWSGNDQDEDGYLTLVETGEKPMALERLAKARKVTIAYPFQGKTRVEAFPFATAQQAMSKLTDCASGR